MLVTAAPKARQILLFLIAGGSAYLTYLIIFYAAEPAISRLPALMAAYPAAMVVQFGFNRLLTFPPNATSTTKRSLGRYLLLVGVAYVATTTVAYSLMELGLNSAVSVTAGIGVVTPISYLASKHWVFD